ncbi:transcription factor IIA subunit alpha [Conglomerata obtusa]
MNFEISRVYRDIIEEVCRSLKADSDELKLSLKQIGDIKSAWGKKLRDITTPTESFAFRPAHCGEMMSPSTFNRTFDKPTLITRYEKVEEPSSELSVSDSDEKQEALYPNYMMCLYDKVDKSKDRWRVKMKQGFLNVGKSEFAFDTAHGSLYW